MALLRAPHDAESSCLAEAGGSADQLANGWTGESALEDANIILERTRPKGKTKKAKQRDKSRSKKKDAIMEEAGIDVVEPDEE